MITRWLPAAALALAACGYTPPGGTNTAAPAYQADYDACSTQIPAAVNRRNAKTAPAWFASGLTRWSEIDDGIAACMSAKGYGRLRACTPDELRQGNRTPGLKVTNAGIQCSDPPRT